MNGILEGCPILLNICVAELQVPQFVVEVIGKGIGVLIYFQLGDINAFQCLFPLRPTFSLDVKVQRRDDKFIGCPTLSTTHGLGNHCILPVSLPGDDIINEMPMFGSRVHPGGFVAVGLTKYRVGDQQLMCDTGHEEQ